MQDTRSDVGAGWAASTVRVEESDAILFDLDGVLTDTASVHRKAWKAMASVTTLSSISPKRAA